MSDYPALFREYQVEEVIRDYLQSQGVAAAPKKLHGADIEAKDDPLPQSRGQICCRMRDDLTIYAIGLPTDEDYVSDVRDINVARKRLVLSYKNKQSNVYAQ